ncbi:MAG TPA: CopG family transcriptional regulator [Arenibaculum sp.]|nr:CopG family transcriptional regulator [Arenibaculum sp.]
MSDDATLTVRLSAETRDRLARLAGCTRRTRSFLAAEAIAAYVERELAIIEGIERGRADVRAGRVMTHDEVARETREIIEAARTSR